MKKILMLIAVVVVILVIMILLGAGGGFGMGTGTGNGEGDGTRNMEAMEIEEDTEVETETSAEEKPEEVVEYLNLKISVVESDYFFENERIDLDRLVEEIQSTDGNIMVEVIDDNASLKAYNKLLDALDDLRIDYIEK